MVTFRRALRLFFAVLGFILGLALAVTAYISRLLIAPPRLFKGATPLDYGMDYEDVHFPAWDGLRVSGWFIPAVKNQTKPSGTIVFVHGWQWNRSGYAASSMFANLTGSKNIELMVLAKMMHEQGYNVLTFDLRNHGQSAAAHPFTFGQREAKDLLGGLTYLETRDDVKKDGIGVIGFSLGANTILHAMPQTDLIKAAVAIQPTTPSLFWKRLTNDILGMAGSPIRLIVELIYRIFGGPRIKGIDPAFIVNGAQGIPVLFIQGIGDNWGTVDDVSSIAKSTPRAQEILFVSSSHRFDGYLYPIQNSGPICSFFNQHLG